MKAKEFMRIYHKLEDIAMNTEAVKEALLEDNMSAKLGRISLHGRIFDVNIETFHYGEGDEDILIRIPIGMAILDD